MRASADRGSDVAAPVDAGLIRSTIHADLGPINAANLKRVHALVESGNSPVGIRLSFGIWGIRGQTEGPLWHPARGS